MSHENARLVSKHFKTIGVPKVWDPEKIVLLFDHRVPAESEETAKGHRVVREFVKEHKLPNFYDMRPGICHQIMPEFGHVRPGELIVGTDSHTTSYGALGAFSTGIGATEMAAVWATGSLWLRVPGSMLVNVEGKMPKMVMSKDLILDIIGKIGVDGADYKAMEFQGSTIDAMSISSRMTICNQAMEAGAKAAMVAADDKAVKYVKARTKKPFKVVEADGDAAYETTLLWDATKLSPTVACPHSPGRTMKVEDVAGVKVDQALLGSCTNGRLEDIEIAAKMLKGKKVHKDVRLIVVPASAEVYLDAMKEGYLEILIKAGGVITNPGCGPCLGAHQGLLAPKEVCISSTNRNFKGRMGSGEADVYLASPATVAASAIKGVIADPREFAVSWKGGD